MFKSRNAPLASRRRPDVGEAAEQGSEDIACDPGVRERLAEVREIQRMRVPQRGVPPMPTAKAQEVEEEEEEDQWGLLDSSFSGAAGKKEVDAHLEAFLNERLYQKNVVEEKREKTREDQLYDIPGDLQVPDATSGAADQMSWVAGLAEVPLGTEYKLANIEATERAKKDFLHGSQPRGVVMEPDAVTRKAFGSRFLHFNDKAGESKSATDDA